MSFVDSLMTVEIRRDDARPKIILACLSLQAFFVPWRFSLRLSQAPDNRPPRYAVLWRRSNVTMRQRFRHGRIHVLSSCLHRTRTFRRPNSQAQVDLSTNSHRVEMYVP